MEREEIVPAEPGSGLPAPVASDQAPTAEAEASENGDDRSPKLSHVDLATEGAPAAGTSGARRTLKLVLTLRPAEGPGYHVLLALGADGCDPLWRSAAVADLPAALHEVPALAADAEARWQAQPRYPTVVPQKAKTSGQRVRPPEAAKPDGQASGQGGPTQPSTSANAKAEDASGPTAKPAPAGQLSLFQ